jgi:hypothetical protein
MAEARARFYKAVPLRVIEEGPAVVLRRVEA